MVESIPTHAQAAVALGALNLPAEGSLKLPDFLLIPIAILMITLSICLIVMRERERKK